MLNNHFFCVKSCRLWDNVKKYIRAGQATDGNVAHAHFMLDNWGYKHTLRMSNNYLFSNVKVVSRTRLKVTLHVRYMSCY